MRISSHLHRLGAAVLLGLVLLSAGTSGAASAAAGPPSLTAGAACEGAVVHSVDAAQFGTLPPLCIAVGGVVRVVNTGPGSLLARPATMVDCFYAAGTYQCRLIRTGTVRLTLAADGRELLVRVPAAVPGQPSTACSPAGSVVDLDTTDELRWWSPCLRIGATLRVVNLGPGLLTVTPAGAVNCYYEAGIHACQFRRPASVVFTAAVDAATRSVTAVAVR
ncbi:hypothetical protein KZ829_12150 [Actinoplanes hulinensis]|uniref:Secreted protein n=1 Tax=Actinoplanes hulinensis TaxID=1144547 RepID=A0ABS7B0B9_9ACTN|nr:hypothetical protein [Actinoplanes hulinensis]MBW6434485.1 hypothetical protein [Actinoplanes hulinensis]